MAEQTYIARRGELFTYFDRTAVDAWSRLTSDAPVGRIRATVRKGRDRMRASILASLPVDMRGLRLLDAGCGTGALALEAARRGARVIAVDLSPTLLDLARGRIPRDLAGSIDFHSGDMLDPVLGTFDHVVAMDSLVHYPLPDVVGAIAALARRTSQSLVFTFAPRTPALAAMHAVGRMFPRGDRAPAIEPVAEAALRRSLAGESALVGWTPRASVRIACGFYQSQSMELVPA